MKTDGPTPADAATIDLIWASAAKYRLTIASPDFKQLRIVNGDQTFEQNDGDFYPKWLENMVQALLNPIPVANFRNVPGLQYSQQPNRWSTVMREDYADGTLDYSTWSSLSLIGPQPLPWMIASFGRFLFFNLHKPFGKQMIAREYSTSVLDSKWVSGKLVTLEALPEVDAKQFLIAAPTLPGQLLSTTFVTTLKEESLIDQPPAIDWPAVQKGNSEGFMIVYARTDRTGQVRETAALNSDNRELQKFGVEQALRYKFHPLIVDGVPQQMEMPLVLRFSSRLPDGVSVLSDILMRRQISNCNVPTLNNRAGSYLVQLSINQLGLLTELTSPEEKNPAGPAPQNSVSLSGCRFAPYLVKGLARNYHGVLVLPR